jgi:hypothetical protein
MFRNLILVTLAACGARSTSTTPEAAQPSASQPSVSQPSASQPYAKLFTEGAEFRYKVEHESSHWDEQNGNVKESSTSMMTCTVGKLELLSDRTLAPLDCDGDLGVPVGGAGPAGIYIATAAGLWRAESVELAKSDRLVPDELLLPAKPRDKQGKPGQVTLTEGPRGTWCASQFYAVGDEGGITLCFGNGTVVSGNASWSGGSSREASFVLVPKT